MTELTTKTITESVPDTNGIQSPLAGLSSRYATGCSPLDADSVSIFLINHVRDHLLKQKDSRQQEAEFARQWNTLRTTNAKFAEATSELPEPAPFTDEHVEREFWRWLVHAQKLNAAIERVDVAYVRQQMNIVATRYSKLLRGLRTRAIIADADLSDSESLRSARSVFQGELDQAHRQCHQAYKRLSDTLAQLESVQLTNTLAMRIQASRLGQAVGEFENAMTEASLNALKASGAYGLLLSGVQETRWREAEKGRQKTLIVAKHIATEAYELIKQLNAEIEKLWRDCKILRSFPPSFCYWANATLTELDVYYDKPKGTTRKKIQQWNEKHPEFQIEIKGDRIRIPDSVKLKFPQIASALDPLQIGPGVYDKEYLTARLELSPSRLETLLKRHSKEYPQYAIDKVKQKDTNSDTVKVNYKYVTDDGAKLNHFIHYAQTGRSMGWLKKKRKKVSIHSFMQRIDTFIKDWGNDDRAESLD